VAIGGLSFRSLFGNIPIEDAPAGLVVRGEVDWIVSGDSAEIATLLAAVGGLGREVQPTSAILTFGNVVGMFDLGRLGRLSVRCGKWGEEKFDEMLSDLTRQLGALPFSAAQTAGIPHDRSLADHDDVLLHAFVYARRVLLATSGEHSLVRALEAVVRDPHRRFNSHRAKVALPYAQRIDTRTLSQIASGASALVRAPNHLTRSELARSLHGFIPETVDVPTVSQTYDTAENRFVLEFLQQLRAIILRVERLAPKSKRSVFWMRTLADCDAMRRALAPFERHDVWIGVREMDHVPLGSTVMQQRRGYKDVLRHYLTMRAAARIPLTAENVEKQLLGIKDVATLYELWCYFAVVEAVGHVLRRPPDKVEEYEVSIDKVTVGRGFKVRWSNGPTVHYNPSFTQNKLPPWKSASLMLRPDVVIEMERSDQVEMHVFDAKLKVDGIASLDTNTEDSDEDDVDPLKFKREDVAKMHAYRDALPQVRSAYVLYPGNVLREFPSLESGSRSTDGVGAIPLVPGQQPTELAAVLERLLVDQTSRSSNATEPSIADLAFVAGLVGDIEAIESCPGQWSGGEPDAHGSIQMPYVTYAPAVERLLRAIYERKVIVNFDWPAWQEDAQRFLAPDLVAIASLEEVRRLLTLHVRMERFVEGHLAEMISDGHITLLLKRLGVLVEELSG